MIGIIGAMSVEVDGLKAIMDNVSVETISSVAFCSGTLCGCNVVIAEAGVGKVNAAVTAQTMILKYNTDCIINTGVAGGLHNALNLGDVVVAERVAEHDMDTTPLGDEPGYITGLNRVYMECDKQLAGILYESAKDIGLNALKGTIVSGDQFIADEVSRNRLKKVFDGYAAEMEGAAIGHVCAMNNVKFGVLRTISDSANSDSHMDFPAFCQMAANNAIEIIKITVPRIGEAEGANR